MRRSEYIEPREGRHLEPVKRFIKKVWIGIQQESGSTNSLSNEEKKFFRKEVKKTLKESKQSAFKSDIVLETQFCTSQDTPPALQNSTKNHLDLLHKSIPNIDSLDKILFPVTYPIGTTAFYAPPIRNIGDLDNLARVIAPTLVKLCSPTPTKESPKKVEEVLPKLLLPNKPSQKLQKNTITNYQIINNPKKEDTLDSGNSDLFTTDPMGFHFNLGNQIDAINEGIE